MSHFVRLRARLLSALAMVGCAALVIPVAATSAEAATTVGCGSTITVDTRLGSNLHCSTGLTLTNGATLDLGGHTLTGPGASSGKTGIEVQGDSPTTVRHGTVKGWGYGITQDQDGTAADTTQLVRRVTLADNGSGLGDDLNSSPDWRVTRSKFVHNVNGITAVGGTITVSRSTFRRNTRTGISSEVATLTLTGGSFSRNADGVHAFGGAVLTIAGTTFSRNDLGVECSERIPSLTNVTFKDNTSYGFHGFDCAGPVTGSTFTGNKVGWFDQSFDEVQATSAGAPPWAPDMKITRSRFRSNGTGVFAREGVTVDRSVFTKNVTGLTASELQKPLVRSSSFRKNRDGIYLTNGGAIGHVAATRNKRYGIYAPGAVDLGGNVAWGNRARPQCVGVVCARRR